MSVGTCGKDTASAKTLNLLGILTVNHVYKLHVLKFVRIRVAQRSFSRDFFCHIPIRQ